LVDLDPAITKLFSTNSELTSLNKNSLKNKKVTVINQDAWKFLEQNRELYDVIIINLPDPNNISLGRLYATTFYALIKSHLSALGMVVTQATSPMYTTKAFWCIAKSMEVAGLRNMAYHTYVPSFGEWGFVLASKSDKFAQKLYHELPIGLRYYDENSMSQMSQFAPDISKIAVQANTLSNHYLVKYYNDGWKKWYGK